MINKEELENYPNYLLTTYQLEIFRQLSIYMEKNKLTQNDIAKELKVSGAYISQILNGNFNFTLKKLIELGLLIGKVPALEFVNFEEYWKREKDGNIASPTVSINISVHTYEFPLSNSTSHVFVGTGQDFGIKESINVGESQSGTDFEIYKN